VKKWYVYISILAIPLLGGTAAQLLRVVIAFMLHDAGVDVFSITLLSSSFMLSRAVFSPVIGKVADRGVNRALIVMGGFAGMLVDAYLYTIVPFPWMFILRILDGIYGAMTWPTMQALVHFSAAPTHRAKTMSIYFMMGTVGLSVGYLIYSAISGNMLYAVILIVMIYFTAILFAYPLRNVKEKREIHVSGDRGGFHGSFYPLTFLFGMYISLGNEVLLFYLTLIVGFSKVDATLILSLASILALGGSLMLGHIADRHGFIRSLVVLSILTPLSAALIAVNYVYSVIVGIFLFFVVGRGFMPISRSFTAARGKKISTSLGIVNFSSNIGSVIAPLIGGAIIDSFASLSLGMFTAVGIFFLLIALSISTSIVVFTRKSGFSIATGA